MSAIRPSESATVDNQCMPNELGRLLTLADVADVLGVSVGEVDELIQTGELPALRIATGVRRVELAVLQAFIDGKAEESRRQQLWEHAEFVDLPEITAGKKLPR